MSWIKCDAIFYKATTSSNLLAYSQTQFIILRSFPAPLEPFNHRYDRSYVSFFRLGEKPSPSHKALPPLQHSDTKTEIPGKPMVLRGRGKRKKKRRAKDGVVSGASLMQ